MHPDGIVRDLLGSPGRKEAYLPAPGPSNHGSNLLELPNGDLLCVWFSGTCEGNPDTNVVLSRLPAGHDCWREPVFLSHDPHRAEQNAFLFLPRDGILRLFHTSNTPHNQNTSRIMTRKSADCGRSWSPAQALPFAEGTFIRNPMVELDNGGWILPAYRCTPVGHYSVVYISNDEGRSWSRHEIPGGPGRVHMSIVLRGQKNLVAFFRSRFADYIYRSTSLDGGESWTVPERTPLFNNNASIQAIALRDGRIAMVFNDVQRQDFEFPQGDIRCLPLWLKAPRTPLNLALSGDGGLAWPQKTQLESLDEPSGASRDADLPGPTFETTENGEQLMRFPAEARELSYPSIIQSADGRLHISFTYRRRCIKYVTISGDDSSGQNTGASRRFRHPHP